ncbi:MAG: amidohydrolase family protein, partial [Deltaproteobacteria bacterium]|nr:amidohydrolase family protein [Deltaproteobacteria bacterium]
MQSELFDLIVRGGTVVTGALEVRADVGIRGEKIAAIAAELSPAMARRTIDAAGKLVLPGAIDVHDHFELPFCGTVSADDFVNGTKAAAMGGVTTVIDFAIQGAGTVMDAVRARREQADPKVCIDYGLHAGITRWDEERKEEIPEIIAAGLPTFKMFMIYKAQGWQSNDGALFAALRETAPLGGMIGVHAENNDLIELLIAEEVARGELSCVSHARTRPDYTESEAIGRAIQWAEATGGRLYIFHLSAGRAARMVAWARSHGIKVAAETCPQYLLLDDELFARPDGHHFATCPPIRKKYDQEELWRGLVEEYLEVVATDTCTFD